MAPTKKGFNEYTIRGDIVAVHLVSKKGDKYDTLIDLDDLDRFIELAYHWSLERTPRGIKGRYARATVQLGCEGGKQRSTTVKLHRLIMNAQPWYQVDHINHNTLDNRKSNLRIATPNENYHNRYASNSNNTSGYRNVTLVQNRWVIQMQVEGKNTRLKSYPKDQLEEAGAYAELMRGQYYGEFAGSN